VKKSLLYRLFRLGGIPKRIRPALEAEGIVVADEGMGGLFVCRNVRAPGKRYRCRSEGFSGGFAVTRKRIIAYTFWKRQVHIGVEDSKGRHLHINVPEPGRRSISFEPSEFRDRWSGVIEFRFRTDRAEAFREALRAVGAQKGTPPVV
jgi:hypothetical protein